MNVFVQLVISWQDNYLFFIINYYMKTSSHVSLTGPRGERGWGMLPHPRLPVGEEIFPVYIPVGEEISPSPSPNRGIPHGESGIGSPLPSLLVRPPSTATADDLTTMKSKQSKCGSVRGPGKSKAVGSGAQRAAGDQKTRPRSPRVVWW
jgi:hypothetical protein